MILSDFEGHFRYCKRFRCLQSACVSKSTKSITTVGRYMLPIIFDCRIRPEGLLYDAEHDLIAIAKLLLITYSFMPVSLDE